MCCFITSSSDAPLRWTNVALTAAAFVIFWPIGVALLMTGFVQGAGPFAGLLAARSPEAPVQNEALSSYVENARQELDEMVAGFETWQKARRAEQDAGDFAAFRKGR